MSPVTAYSSRATGPARPPFGLRMDRRSTVGRKWHPTSGADKAPGKSGGKTAQHPLADAAASAALKQRTDNIKVAFSGIEPLLTSLATRQFDAGFPEAAQTELQQKLAVDIATNTLQANWLKPLDMARIQALSVLGVFCNLADRDIARSHAAHTALEDGEDAGVLIRRWGFHAIDITPCADGRLAGVIDHILRVPADVIAYRQSHAGAMFSIDETLRNFETVELRRWSNNQPNPATDKTAYLKIGVYHFSSRDPQHQGCAAHGSDDTLAAGALLRQLENFHSAVAAVHGGSDRAAVLLVGVDTDTDAIRIHVPDATGQMCINRHLSSDDLYDQTLTMAREPAKEHIRDAVAKCAGVDAADDATQGMRWLCGYLLKNNLSQVEAVRAIHGGAYAENGHNERLIVVGDALDEVQLRNLAFQAQMRSAEEGAGDLDVGMKILGGLTKARGLMIPVLVHFSYDGRIPGAKQAADIRARRVSEAVRQRYCDGKRKIAIQAVIRARDAGAIEPIEIEMPGVGNHGGQAGQQPDIFPEHTPEHTPEYTKEARP